MLPALTDDEAAQFSDEYAALLRTAHPAVPYGTVFPFLRTFVVAHEQRRGAVTPATSSGPHPRLRQGP